MRWERLQEALHYDPLTGIWTWKIKKGRAKIGDMAGVIATINKVKRRYMKLDQEQYSSSRLAWFYMTKEWPKNEIDHIDRNTLNDKWSNLRDVTHAVNCKNRGTLR